MFLISAIKKKKKKKKKTVYGIIFVVEIEQKQAMCLKRKSLN